MYIYFDKLKKLFMLVAAFVVFVSAVAPTITYGLSAEQKKLLNKGIYYYDLGCSASSPSVTPDSDPSNSSVYMVGDSITDGAEADLKSEFKDYKNVYINGSGSRSITGEGVTSGLKTSGLEAVEGDKERIKNAGIVVVALGTNQNPNFESSIKDLVNKIKSYNSSAELYWVNVFSVGGSNGYPKLDRKGINESIDKQSSLGYEVIDTVQADITLGDSIHPDTAGYKDFAKVVVNGLGQSSDKTLTPPAQGGCTCQGGGAAPVTLSGNDNEEKVWNYFAQPEKGLSPVQIAGIMGNFKVESDFDPTVVFGGGHSNDPASVSVAWGLAQWLPGSKVLIAQKNAGVSGDITLLSTQLEVVWWEMTNRSPTSYLNFIKDYKKINDLVEARIFFQQYFEGSLGQGDAARDTAAKELLAKYGSGTPGSDSGGSSDCASSGGDTGGPFSPFTGTAQEAAKALLGNDGIKIYDDRDMLQQLANGQSTPLSDKLVKFLAGLAKTYDFGISSLYRGPCSGSNHCTGNAVDINPTIDGQTISYDGTNPKIQKFIDDAAELQGGDCENGLPNQAYVDKTKANGSKCEVFVDRGTGAHVHLSVKA